MNDENVKQLAKKFDKKVEEHEEEYSKLTKDDYAGEIKVLRDLRSTLTKARNCWREYAKSLE